MTQSDKLKTKTGSDAELWQMRIDLAAAFRLAAEMNWHEFGRQSLQPCRFARRQEVPDEPALEAFLADQGERSAVPRQRGPRDDEAGADAPDPSAWCIHGRIHANLPQARCLLHLHPPYATALAALAEPDLKPIDQNTARFFNRLAIDLDYAGIADDRAEGDRLARKLGNKSRMIMGNHGVLIAAATVAEAFEDLYFLERACQTMVMAYSTGQKLNVMPDELAEKTARGWDGYQSMAFAHFEDQKRLLDRKDPSYAE